jgi:hypothetical protein
MIRRLDNVRGLRDEAPIFLRVPQLERLPRVSHLCCPTRSVAGLGMASVAMEPTAVSKAQVVQLFTALAPAAPCAAPRW